jgi:hypothetical protein
MMRGSNTTSTTVQIASGVDRSGAVLILGIGLIVVNLIFGTNPPLITYFSPTSKSRIPTSVIVSFALTLLVLLVLLLLAKTGEYGGNLAVLFLAAMWIVWLLNKPAAVAKILQQPSGSSSTSGAK